MDTETGEVEILRFGCRGRSRKGHAPRISLESQIRSGQCSFQQGVPAAGGLYFTDARYGRQAQQQYD